MQYHIKNYTQYKLLERNGMDHRSGCPSYNIVPYNHKQRYNCTETMRYGLSDLSLPMIYIIFESCFY